MPTQSYDAPSGKSGKRFFGIMYVELEGVHDMKWNTETVIVFQSVILKRAQGLNNSAQIHKRILFRLNFCNCRSFDKLVKYMYNSAMVYLRKTRGNQMEEQRHRTFLTLVLKGKLREDVQLVCDKGMGEFCNQNNWLRIVQA